MTALKRSLLLLFRFSPRARIGMLMALDVGICAFVALLAYSLRIGEWRVFRPVVGSLMVLTMAGWFVIAPLQGVYRSLLRFFGPQTIKDLALSCILLSILLAFFVVVFPIDPKIPRTLTLLLPIILFVFLCSARAVLSSLLRETLYSRTRAGRKHVLVYGAGVAGRELTLSINDDPEFQVIGFIDDNPVLRGRRLEGYHIWHSTELPNVLRKYDVHEILLAIPAASRARRRRVVDDVRELAPGVGVRSLPNLSEIASGKVSISDLREIQIEDLLGRDQVNPDPQLMSANILDRAVMITGAGGSIGSELCRQIILQMPARIILADRSELGLYTIDAELRHISEAQELPVQIQSKLVDVADHADLERVYRQCRPDTVFHAAAYKHVPLVEADPIAGIRNNILGTYNCCILAERHEVKNFTLVSTDKAVRPSSVMGASKRVCEMIVLARSAAQQTTTYSCVRFGNVLGSSGSVVPLFRRQIAAGGPVTVTDRNATRYFMTVPEAAQLVVQAGAMAKGGEIFLLDMGEPVRIHDLAEMMIQLSGLTARTQEVADGDIEIAEIGLRPGEKVHEELLIDHQALPTSHPRIVKASESNSDMTSFERSFEGLLNSINARDAETSLAIMRNLIDAESERRSSSVADDRNGAAETRNRRSSSSRARHPLGGSAAIGR